MRPQGPVVAESARFYRFFSPGPSRVSLVGDAVCIEGRPSDPEVEIPVGSLEELTAGRSLFWSRLTIRTAAGTEHNVGGLDERTTARLLGAVRQETARHAGAVGPQLERIDGQLRQRLAGERYIRHSQYGEFDNLIVVLASVLEQCGGLVREHLDRSAKEALLRLEPLVTDGGVESAREQANGKFVLGSISVVQEVVGSALQSTLTDEQAEAIASDEDTTLVLAGAGTGKTAVVVGKVAHLVRNLGVSPDEILVVAYNRRAADEISQRLSGNLSTTPVSTVHAFGRRVIAESARAPTVSKLAEDNSALVVAVEGILREILDDPQQSQGVIRFIANHHAPYRSAFDFATRPQYDEYVRHVELRTLSGDRVKSFEELVIANYLTEHGIDFEYERPYEQDTATRARRQYQPDFFLPAYDIYIEHFALNEEGLPPSDWQGYLEGVEWKRDTHRRYGSKLIETYSWQYRQESLLPELRAQLDGAGVLFERVPVQTLVRQLSEQRVSWLAGLLSTFLNHVKGGGLQSDELRAQARTGRDRQRNERFLDVFDLVHVRYEQLLATEKALDFHDLINLAASTIREGRWLSPYKYVLVDEFQDISAGRMALLQSLKSPGVAYFLVGDDWQSIYRFAGSDVRLVRGCGGYLGHVRERALSRTFRFADGILGPSTAFVRRNPEQTQRPLRPARRSEDDGITVITGDNPANGLLHALQEIEAKAGGRPRSVLVLGRYHHSLERLRPLGKSSFLEVWFSTVHAAKGREADYVVVVDLTDDRWGFPSRIEDDPLLEIVLPPVSGSSYPFAEERRLFYVAMTRAKIGAYLIADSVRPSRFVAELLRESTGLRVLGELAPECPRCPSGRLLPSESRKTLRCSNFPNCEYLAPRCPNCNVGYAIVARNLPQSACTNPACDRPPTICPSCGTGVLLVRKGRFGSFWGCSEYWSEPSCPYTRDIGPRAVRRLGHRRSAR